MKSVSLKASSLQEFQTIFKAAYTPDFTPTIGIVFCSKNFDMNRIGSSFRDAKVEMVGCTTAGEIKDTKLLEDSIVCLLMDMPKEYFKVHFSSYGKNEIYKGAFQTGLFAKDSFKNPGLLVMSGGITVDANKLMSGLKDGVGKEVPMYGGLAGDNLEMEATWVFTHKNLTNNGLATLIIDTDKYSMEGLATSGWEALGGLNTITKSEGNIVHTINGESAYDVFIRYFGISDNATTKQDLLITIQTNYPFQFQRKEGHFILRSPILLDAEKRTIQLAAGVTEGEQFRFSSSPGFEVIEKTIKEFSQLKEKAESADAALLFSCKGRHGAFGPILEEEIEGIFNYWKTPLIGFLSYGEIGNMDSGVCEFHNETCALVLIKEKEGKQ